MPRAATAECDADAAAIAARRKAPAQADAFDCLDWRRRPGVARKGAALIQQLDTIDKIRSFFSTDRFATDCVGAQVDSFDYGTFEAQASLDVGPQHLNGHGIVMGGVYFTLADFALAVSCNVNQEPTSSVNSSINIMHSCKGSRLVARARPDHAGRRVGFYTIDVFDDLGTHCARMTTTVVRR